ncbi:MAG: hypothetical protein ABR584_06090 [Candidatus Baltobacteraceae bacterium]
MRNPLPAFVFILLVAGLAACSHREASTTTTTTSSQQADGSDAAAADTSTTTPNEAAINDSIQKSGIVTSRNACELLVRPDAEAAAGQPLPQNTTKNVALGMCDFNATDFSAGASLTVGSWDSIKTAMSSGPHQPVAVSGIGDEALNLGGHLAVRKGDEGISVEVHGPKIDGLPDHGLAAEENLAAKILARF